MTDPRPISDEDFESDTSATERLYPELAKANLLRMRGEYKAAIDACLSILKRLPDHVDAHTLIGDIYSESGDLGQAEQWYELALELSPKDETLKAKLASVRDLTQNREIAETAEQLGLPPDRPPLAAFWAGGVALLLIVAIVAYLIGQKNPAGEHHTRIESVSVPTSAGDDSSTDAGKPDKPTGDTGSTAASTQLSGSEPQDDRTLTMTLAQRSRLGPHIISAMEDPRTKVITMTYTVRADDDQRKIGAELAREALEQVPDAITVTLRAVRDDRLQFMADVSRTKISETLTGDWQEQNGGTADAWTPYVLSYEWTPSPPSDSGSSGTSSPSPPPSSSTASPTANPPASGSQTTAGAPSSTGGQ